MPTWPNKNPRPGVDEYGRSPLWHLASKGDTAGLRSAIAEGANVSQADSAGLTPLHMAVQKGHVEVIELLLSAGADPNAPDKHGNGPLWTAVLRPGPAEPTVAIIRTLLKAGASATHENAHGRSPIQMAKRIANGLEVPFVERERGAA